MLNDTDQTKLKRESFCKCFKNCNCGEDQEVHWTWETKDVTRQIVLSNEDKDVRFHPGYSSGTAAIRGKYPCLPGHHYFWEIKMLSSLYGTDVMVGVGTDKAELRLWAYRFCSMLGQDENSWGYSYRGSIQHKGRFMQYGPRFGKGSIIGVHLDMCAGTIEFFHNREPLGVAFTNLGSTILFPMVCSTAARSEMRVICAVSYVTNLQLDCLLTIGKHNRLIEQLKNIPGLKSTLTEFWWTMPSAKISQDLLENENILSFIENNQVDNFLDTKNIRKRPADPLWNSDIEMDSDESTTTTDTANFECIDTSYTIDPTLTEFYDSLPTVNK